MLRMAAQQPRARVLLVEDDRASRQALRVMLQQWGYEALAAETVADGILKLDEDPAAVLLDLMLPDGFGVRLLRGIRALDFPVPIAVITGANDQDLLKQVHELRPEAFFTKPLDPPRVQEWLRGVTGAH